MTISTTDYAFLSDMVYDPLTDASANLTGSPSGSEYDVIKVKNDVSGYFGVVFQNVNTLEIVVAHRGTEIPDDAFRDLLTADG